MLTIGEFSSATRLTVKALRIYHEEGLLVPERVDAVTGYRYYGDGSFRRAQAIVILRDLGFSIQEMGAIFAQCADDDELGSFFRRRLAEVERELARMREVRGLIRVYGEGEREETMRENLEIREITANDAWMCGIRYRGAYANIGRYFSDLFKKAGRYYVGKPFALYYDCEHREEADIEAGILVRREVSIPGVDCRVLPGGNFVSILHRGPYEALGVAYKALFEYLSGKNLELGGPLRELYLKGPGMIFPRDPSRFVTEIRAPVVDRATPDD